MQSSTLFIHLVLHLRHYADAAVLWAVLNEHADVQEYRTTSTAMASAVLGETVDRKTVQRSFKRLEDLGLVSVRIQSKTATRISVNRQAVLELLRTRLRSDLPGLDTSADFPFLHAWAEDRKALHLVGA